MAFLDRMRCLSGQSLDLKDDAPNGLNIRLPMLDVKNFPSPQFLDCPVNELLLLGSEAELDRHLAVIQLFGPGRLQDHQAARIDLTV